MPMFSPDSKDILIQTIYIGKAMLKELFFSAAPGIIEWVVLPDSCSSLNIE